MKELNTFRTYLKESEETNLLSSVGFKGNPGGNYHYKFTHPFVDGAVSYVAYNPGVSKSNVIIDKFGQELKTFDSVEDMVNHLQTNIKLNNINPIK